VWIKELKTETDLLRKYGPWSQTVVFCSSVVYGLTMYRMKIYINRTNTSKMTPKPQT